MAYTRNIRTLKNEREITIITIIYLSHLEIPIQPRDLCPSKGHKHGRRLHTNHHHHHQSLFIHEIVSFYMVFLGIVFKRYIKFYKFG